MISSFIIKKSHAASLLPGKKAISSSLRKSRDLTMRLRLLLIALIATAAEATSSAADASLCVNSFKDCLEQCRSSNCDSYGLRRSGDDDNLNCECSGCSGTEPKVEFPICCVAPHDCITRMEGLNITLPAKSVTEAAGMCVVCNSRGGGTHRCSGPGWLGPGTIYGSLPLCTQPLQPTSSPTTAPPSSPTTAPPTPKCVGSSDECDARCGGSYSWKNSNGVYSCYCEPTGPNLLTCNTNNPNNPNNPDDTKQKARAETARREAVEQDRSNDGAGAGGLGTWVWIVIGVVVAVVAGVGIVVVKRRRQQAALSSGLLARSSDGGYLAVHPV